MIETYEKLKLKAIGRTQREFKAAVFEAGVENSVIAEFREEYGEEVPLDEILGMIWSDTDDYEPTEKEALVDEVTSVICDLAEEIAERPNDYKGATLKRIGGIRDQLRRLEREIVQGVF